MKKILQMFYILASLILLGCVVFWAQNRNVQFEMDENGTLVLALTADGSEELLYPWVDANTGTTYFFLPSFVRDNQIYSDNMEKDLIRVDGECLSKWRSFKRKLAISL